MQAVQEPDPPLPPLKMFKPKVCLPPVTDYRAKQSPQFWEQFPKNTSLQGISPINPVRLRSWANAVGCDDRDRLELVCRDLENGADIGCRGRARDPTVSGNAPSAIEAGAQVTDALAEWVQQGIVAGPFPPESRPGSAKVNGIMCRMKPNGTARIIVNLSAPKGKVPESIFSYRWFCFLLKYEPGSGAKPDTENSSKPRKGEVPDCIFFPLCGFRSQTGSGK